MIRHIGFLLCGFLIVANLSAQRNPKWAVPVEAKALHNMYMVDTGVYRAAQPEANGFTELEQMGIKEVLNLRRFNHNDKSAEKTGLTFHHIRMWASNCDWDKAVEALRIIKNRKGPILIHCKHGADRTGLVIALYRIVFQNWSKDDAIDELKNGGYNFHSIYANIPSFIENIDVEVLKKAVMKE